MSMNRVLSFPQSQTCDGAAEFVSKRFCFSCVCAVAFVSLISGFMLGRKTGDETDTTTKVTNVHSEPNIHFPFDRSRSTFTDFNQTWSNDDNLNETYKDAVYLQSILKRFYLDFVSSLYREEVFISLKDISFLDQIKIFSGENLVYYAVSNYITKYGIPKQTLYRKSTSSNITGVPIFVNYGRHEDFKILKKFALNNYIALIRLGKIPIEDKIEIAFNEGASGVLLFSDPRDYPAYDSSRIYQEILPILLGKIQLFYEKSKQADSKTRSNEIHMECAPVQIISAAVAEEIFKKMAIPASTEKIVPKTGFTNDNMQLLMNTYCVHVLYENYDLAAYIRGKEEPDRYVIVGSHRQLTDKAEINVNRSMLLLGVIKTFSDMKHDGWIPRRTIIFLNWGLEGVEYYKCPAWLVQRKIILSPRTVSYIYINGPVQELYKPEVETVSVLDDLVLCVMSELKNRTFHNNLQNGTETKLRMADSYQLLTFQAPTILFQYNDNNISETTVNTSSTLLVQKTVPSVLLSVIYSLANSRLLPYNLMSYADVFSRSVDNIYELYQERMKQLNVSSNFDNFRSQVKTFCASVETFKKRCSQHDNKDNLHVRIMNDQMMNLNKHLLCITEHLKRPLLLSENENGFAFGILEDNLTSENSYNSTKMAISENLKYAALCLIQATNIIDFNF